MAQKKKEKDSSGVIAFNRRASHEYAFLEHFEAGMVLEGWEVKSLRAGKGQISDSYVIIKDGEAYLLGMHVQPLLSASTHIHPDPTRSRKLLLHKAEIRKLIGACERKGLTLVALRLFWQRNRVKLAFALAQGKKLHDKRADLKEKAWEREQGRLLKSVR